jgi:hypothetical protein
MNKHKVLIHIFPLVKDIDYLERTLYLLKQNFLFVNKNKFYIILDVTLPTSDYLTNWDDSILKLDYFINKFEHLKSYGDCWDECHFNVNDQVFGLLDNFIISLNKHKDVDDVIILETDIVFNQYTINFLLESSYAVKQTNPQYIITPESTKLWDSSWDIITNSKFINKPFNYRDIGDPILDTSFDGNEIEIEPLTSGKNKYFKFGGGWFVLYSKELLNKINFPHTLKGYGALDDFITQYCSYSQIPTQYKLKNLIISEDCKYTKSSLYDNYVKTHNRKNDYYQINNQIMAEHLKNIWNH